MTTTIIPRKTELWPPCVNRLEGEMKTRLFAQFVNLRAALSRRPETGVRRGASRKRRSTRMNDAISNMVNRPDVMGEIAKTRELCDKAGIDFEAAATEAKLSIPADYEYRVTPEMRENAKAQVERWEESLAELDREIADLQFEIEHSKTRVKWDDPLRDKLLQLKCQRQCGMERIEAMRGLAGVTK